MQLIKLNMVGRQRFNKVVKEYVAGYLRSEDVRERIVLSLVPEEWQWAAI